MCGLFFVCMQNRRICGTAAKEQKTKEKASRRMQRLSEYAWAARGIKAACYALQMRCAAACARRYVNAPSGYRFAEACRPCFFTAMMFLWADHPCGIPSDRTHGWKWHKPHFAIAGLRERTLRHFKRRYSWAENEQTALCGTLRKRWDTGAHFATFQATALMGGECTNRTLRQQSDGVKSLVT